jgi:pyrimidine-nucleoside phosphorylase
MDEHVMRRCIERKRDGGELRAQDWEAIVAGYMDRTVDDAQMAALCMACVLKGMSFNEAFALTHAMVESGVKISFPTADRVVVDKHSSGGVSDIVSLVAVPLAAAAGAHVAKLSGRALGHTGGTIDKLETIPGFNVALSIEQFVAQVERIRCAIAAQTEALVPADKRIYHLRDRTATVPALGLIAASIVSKKIASGAHGFVFDVKTGAASFVSDPQRAHELATWLIEISKRFNRRATAIVSDMNQPLGRNIGTGIEIIEAREFLRGEGDRRARELVVKVASALLTHAGIDDADARVVRALEDGSGYLKMLEMIVAQGGDAAGFEAMHAGEELEIVARKSGYVHAIDVVRLGHAGRRLSAHDPTGGLRVNVRIGDGVEKGQPVLYACGRDRANAADLADAFFIEESTVAPPPLVYEELT